MENIKVSIIIPSYKRHKDIVGRAIHSLLNQTYQNIEIVLVDDNAKEDLYEYREELLNLLEEINDNRIKYIQNDKNLGGAGSRNIGVHHANGGYITFLDDDDEYLPEKIEKQIKYMLNNNLDMSFTKLCLYNEFGVLIDVREYNDLVSYEYENLLKYHLVKQITGTPTFMLKREIFNNIGGFKIVPMGQEYYLMYRIIESKCKIGYLDECYVKAYRTSGECISNGPNKLEGQLKLLQFKKQFFNMLTNKERRYIKCRHYAVVAFTHKRNKRYFAMLWNLFVATLVSPVVAIREAINLKRRIKENKQ